MPYEPNYQNVDLTDEEIQNLMIWEHENPTLEPDSDTDPEQTKPCFSPRLAPANLDPRNDSDELPF